MKNNLIAISGKIGSGKDLVGEIIQYLHDKNAYGYTNPTNVEDFKSYIKNEHSKSSNFEIKKFAGKIKDIVCLLLGCTRDEIEDREFKEKELGKEWWKYKVWRGGEMTEDFKESYLNYSIVKESDILNNWEEYELIKLTPRTLLQLLGTECGRQIIHPDIWVNALFANYYVKDEKSHPHNLDSCNWIITDTRFLNEIKAIKDRNGICIKVERSIKERFPIEFEDYFQTLSNEEWEDLKLPADDLIIEKNFLNWLKINDNKLWQSITHTSETSLDKFKDWDYIITNNGSVEDLITQIKNLNLI